jgi:hypothetical protein
MATSGDFHMAIDRRSSLLATQARTHARRHFRFGLDRMCIRSFQSKERRADARRSLGTPRRRGDNGVRGEARVLRYGVSGAGMLPGQGALLISPLTL